MLDTFRVLCDTLHMAITTSFRATRITESADRLASNPSWIAAEREHEIARLQSIIRNAQATAEDKRIAASMLTFWIEEN
jgi:hypothetical protein